MSDEQRTPLSNLILSNFMDRLEIRTVVCWFHTRIAIVQGANHLIAPLFSPFPNLVGASADESCGLRFYRRTAASEPSITIHRLPTVQN
ncbi:hypothetical protein P692DRAFT_20837327 [Suillus brevipes Sb2]|nr:hypothetical protein P692DRAFT_20837327 [Suillus brevipes Sb2]